MGLSQSAVRSRAMCLTMNWALLWAAMSAGQIETSGSANRLCLDCTSLAKAALSCLALNLLTTNYKTITVVAFPKMTPVVVGASEQGTASLSVCSSSVLHSFSPTLLLSQLAVDKITVLATEEQKVLTDEFLLWSNEICKIVCGTALRLNASALAEQSGNKQSCVGAQLSQEAFCLLSLKHCHIVVCHHTHGARTHSQALSGFTYVTAHWFNYTGSWPCDILLIYDVMLPFTSQPTRKVETQGDVGNSQEFKPLFTMFYNEVTIKTKTSAPRSHSAGF